MNFLLYCGYGNGVAVSIDPCKLSKNQPLGHGVFEKSPLKGVVDQLWKALHLTPFALYLTAPTLVLWAPRFS